MGLQTPPFDVGEIGRVAPFHAQERKSSTYPTRFSKQFRNTNSRKFISRIVDIHPIGPGLSRSWLERDAYEACSKILRG